jgi:hypothetical protein
MSMRPRLLLLLVRRGCLHTPASAPHLPLRIHVCSRAGSAAAAARSDRRATAALLRGAALATLRAVRQVDVRQVVAVHGVRRRGERRTEPVAGVLAQRCHLAGVLAVLLVRAWEHGHLVCKAHAALAA